MTKPLHEFPIAAPPLWPWLAVAGLAVMLFAAISATVVNPNLNVLTWNTNSLALTGSHGRSLPLKFDGSVKHFKVFTNGVVAGEFDMDTTIYPFPLWSDDPNTKVVIVKMTP